MRRIDAGAAQFEQFARKRENRRDVILRRRVEMPHGRCRRPPDQTVGPHHRFRPIALAVIQHQQMVGHRVIRVAIPARSGGGGIGNRPHFVVKNPVA